ncbi:MAG: PDZ domain-containing protein [Sphingobacteriales bacterium]
MKKYFILTTALFIAASSLTAKAQNKKDDDKIKKEKEIVIRQKDGGKATIIVDGDKVTINGKPADEWKDGDVEVYNYNERPRIRIESSPRVRIPRGDFKMYRHDGEDDNRGLLGVTMRDNVKGAEITEVKDKSAAEKAGLQKGDIITKVGDKKVKDAESLTDAVKSYKANEEVTVNFLRDGKEKSVKAKLDKRSSVGFWRGDIMPKMDMGDFGLKGLGELDELKGIPFDNFGRGFIWGHGGSHKLGIKIQDLEEGDGVKIIEVEDSSIAAKAGLKKDDLLLEVSGDKIQDTNDARETIWENWEKGKLNLKIKRNGNPMDIEVKIPKKIKSTDL